MRSMIVFALTLAACGSPEPAGDSTEPTGGGESTGPTFAGDVAAICNAPNQMAGELDAAAPESRSRLLAQHIAGQVQTQESRDFFAVLATMAPAERAAALRDPATYFGSEHSRASRSARKVFRCRRSTR